MNIKVNLYSCIESKIVAVDDSYGIQVAKLADLPEKVISRAQVILSEFEASAGKNHRYQI